jgi:glycerophosphoryl diester phosphodiesterase
VRTLQEIKKIDSTIVTALLIGNMNSFEKNLQQLGYTPEIYSPIYMLVNKKLIANCHKKGIRIIPWTVNDEKKMLKLKQQDVDGLITDYPNIAVKVLR